MADSDEGLVLRSKLLEQLLPTSDVHRKILSKPLIIEALLGTLGQRLAPLVNTEANDYPEDHYRELG